jgi:hypothetical protein
MSPYIHSCSHLHANQASRKEAADKYSEDRRVESQVEPNDNSRRRENQDLGKTVRELIE